MKKVILTFIFCLLSMITKAQDQPLPAAVSKLLLKGYEVLNSTSDDLNRDAYPDLIVVLNKGNEKETSDVALHPENGRCSLLLVAQNVPADWPPAAIMPFTAWIAAV